MAGCQGRAAYWQSHVTPAGCSVAKIRHRHQAAGPEEQQLADIHQALQFSKLKVRDHG